MEYKQILIPSDRKIHVFDNLFTNKEKEHFFEVVLKSNYNFGSRSNDENYYLQYSLKTYLQSTYSEIDVQKMKFLTSENAEPFLNILTGFEPKRAYVYVSDHTTQHFFHVDPEDITLLYYANVQWDNSFGGETMFASDKLDEILFTSMCVPGRLMLFSSKIPHKISPPSSASPFYRFTFVMNWRKNETHNGETIPIQTN